MQFDTTTSSSWQFGHRGRVAVFIDGNNLFHAARFHNIDIDYNKLLRVLLGDGRLLSAFFYTGVDVGAERQQGFLLWMRRNGFRVVQKELKTFYDGTRKANLDVEIAVDMLSLAGRYDTAVLVSGDEDFVYAINAVAYKGCRVEVAGFRSNYRSAADRRRRLFYRSWRHRRPYPKGCDAAGRIRCSLVRSARRRCFCVHRHELPGPTMLPGRNRPPPGVDPAGPGEVSNKSARICSRSRRPMKFFTLAEANEIIPDIRPKLQRLMHVYARVGKLRESARAAAAASDAGGGMTAGPAYVTMLFTDRKRSLTSSPRSAFRSKIIPAA